MQSDAGSETSRASDYEWFRGVLTTRLEPSAWAVIIQTRWNDTDIIGQIKDSESCGQWQFVNLSAIAGENDVLGRSEGEALWPSRWPIERLRRRRSRSAVVVFSGLYAGDPRSLLVACFSKSCGSPIHCRRIAYRYVATIRASSCARRVPPPGSSSPTRTALSPPALRPAPYIRPLTELGALVHRTIRSAVVKTNRIGRRQTSISLMFFADRLEYTDLRRAVVSDPVRQVAVHRVYSSRWLHPDFPSSARSRKARVSPLSASTQDVKSKEARVESLTGLFRSRPYTLAYSWSLARERLDRVQTFPSRPARRSILDADDDCFSARHNASAVSKANRSRTDSEDSPNCGDTASLQHA